jgi:hypothetical protein
MRVRIPIAVTLAAVMAVSSFGISTASAAPVAPLQKAVQVNADQADVIQVASGKRHRGNNNAAAAAVFMGIVGGMIALSARDRDYDRGRYDNRGYGGRYYRDPGYAYQSRPYRQRNPVPYYVSPDSRGNTQSSPGIGSQPQSFPPDAR